MSGIEKVENTKHLDTSDKNPDKSKIDNLLGVQLAAVEGVNSCRDNGFKEYKGEKKDEIDNFCNRENLKKSNTEYLIAFFDEKLLNNAV